MSIRQSNTMKRSPEFSGTRMNSMIDKDKNRNEYSNKAHLKYKIFLNPNSRCIGTAISAFYFSYTVKNYNA